MLIRALIVLLVVINLGVAGWWLTRDAPEPPAPRQPEGVSLLQLTQEAPPVASVPEGDRPAGQGEPAAPQPLPATLPTPLESEPAPARLAVAAPPPPKVVMQCLALGPFADQPAARAAQARLSPVPARSSLRRDAQPPTGYAVLLPPLSDRAAAQAMIERLVAAGVDDYMIISNGPSTNGVALGKYGSRESAQRRQADLRARGFSAQIQPAGEVIQWWLDVGVASSEEARVRRQSQATRALARQCG